MKNEKGEPPKKDYKTPRITNLILDAPPSWGDFFAVVVCETNGLAIIAVEDTGRRSEERFAVF
jgi:hypothetical protein